MNDVFDLANMHRSCEFCTDGEHSYCDSCGHATTLRRCPLCGSLTCEMEAMEVGDAREAAGLPRIEEQGSRPRMTKPPSSAGGPEGGPWRP